MGALGNKSAYPVAAIGAGLRLIDISWAIGGTGAVGVVSVGGVAGAAGSAQGWTVTRTATGLYTVVLTGGCQALCLVLPTSVLSAGADSDYTVLTAVASTGTITTRFNTAGAAADPGNGARLGLLVLAKVAG